MASELTSKDQVGAVKFGDQEKHLRSLEVHYKTLKNMGVDLNKYLSQKADRVIRLEGGSPTPHIHLKDHDVAE